MKRKYNEYKVVVKYSNGSSKEVSCDSNYKEMIDMYRSAKNEFANNEECMSVEFIGIGQDEVSVMFSKVFQREDETTQEDVTQEDVIDNIGDTYLELIKQIEKLTCRIKSREKFLWSELSILDKKQDKCLHDIENGLSLPLANKVQIFNSINTIRSKRRKVKDEIFMIQKIGSSPFSGINNKIKRAEKMKDRQISFDKSCDSTSRHKDYVLKKVVKLDTIKSKNNMETQLNKSPKYDKIEYDSKRMVFNCYTKK